MQVEMKLVSTTNTSSCGPDVMRGRRTSTCSNSCQVSLTVARIIAELIRLQNIIEGMTMNKNYKDHLTRGMEMERNMLEKASLETTQHMGYLRLHPHQRIVVKHFVKGRDMFVMLQKGAASLSATVVCHWSLPGPESGNKMHLT